MTTVLAAGTSTAFAQQTDPNKKSVAPPQKLQLPTADLKSPAPNAGANVKVPVDPITPTSWPSFRNGNAQTGIATSPLPEKLELLWTHQAGDVVVATAAIVGRHVYVGSLKGELLCLDRKTGKRLWTYQSKTDVDPKLLRPGFKAAPTVTADTIYIGDEEGGFHAVDRATGKQRWSFAAGGEIAGAATLFEDRVIFGSHDNNLYCLSAKTGEKVWVYATEGMVNCSSAIIGQHTFVTGCDEHLRVIDVKTGKQVHDMPLGSYVIASPAVAGDILYVGTHGAEFLAVDWKNEKTVWSFKDTKEFPYHSSAAVNDRYVIVGNQNKKVHCLDRKTGTEVWAFPTKAKINSSPVIAGDRVFVGSGDGNVYGLSLKEGKEVWRHTDGRPFTASPAIGEGVLVISSEANDGNIYCFGAKN